MTQIEAAQLVIVVHDGDAAAATAIRALHHNRIAVRLREIKQLTHVTHRFGNTGDRRDFRAGGNPAGRDLVTQINQGFRIGTDPDGSGLTHLGCE